MIALIEVMIENVLMVVGGFRPLLMAIHDLYCRLASSTWSSCTQYKQTFCEEARVPSITIVRQPTAHLGKRDEVGVTPKVTQPNGKETGESLMRRKDLTFLLTILFVLLALLLGFRSRSRHQSPHAWLLEMKSAQTLLSIAKRS